ncbi:MAG: hypothetical protein JW850_02705 [Thermoflexales bacterium]|nr:hypothetical protein [Thermoflexales bacterium]
MSSRQGGSGRGVRRTQGDYARTMLSALFILVLLGISMGGAFWADSQYGLRQLLQVPRNIPDMVIPIALGLGAFGVLVALATTVTAPFFRSKKDELDEYGMYKHRGPGER